MLPNIHQVDTENAIQVQNTKPTINRRLMLMSALCLGAGLYVQATFAADNAAVKENLYQTKYLAQNNSQLKSLVSAPETKLELGKDKAEDNTLMLENGYDLMGSSDFVSPAISTELARAFGKAIAADTVLVYESKVPVNTTLISLDGSDEGKKMASDANSNNSKSLQAIHGATYWAKLPKPLLGVHVIKLVPATDKEGAALASEVKGLTIIAVIKESPAAKANVLKGDNLLKIGEMVLDQPDDLFAAVKRYKGQSVPVELQRDGETKTVKLQLNNR
jgi:hypothetical protein